MADIGAGNRSRRAVLGTALGAVGALVAHALGRPSTAQADNGGAVLLGNSNFETARTAIYQQDAASAEQALFAYTFGTGIGLAAVSVGGDGADIYGGGAGRVGIRGHTANGGTGVLGASYLENQAAPDPEPKTGLFGYATQDAAARGVYGLSTLGTGVRGQTTSLTGTGGRFVAPTGGQALAVLGRSTFSRSGIAKVSSGHSSVDITVSGGLASGSMILATIQGSRPGVAVSSVRLNYPSTGKARVYLTKSVSASTPVAWFALG